MNAKATIRKVLFVTVWLCIGGGMLTLLLAAIGKKNREHCHDYSITIKAAQNNFFVNEKDVQQLLVAATNGSIKGQPLSSFNLHQLEQLLEDNTWIKDAELYFDNRDILHISITEREPIARIFTSAGNSFYIDNTTKRMPLSEKLSAKVPVFTGFPEKKVMTLKDSLLLNDVNAMAQFILSDPVWMAQVAQVDITPERRFEMIPVVGNHLVKLGNGENVDKKFHRLFVFYKKVLSKAGFSKYRVIDVQYAGQVIALKKTDEAKVDSVQLRKNVEKLLQQAQQSQTDSITDTKQLTEKPNIKVDPATVRRDSIGAPAMNLKATAGKKILPTQKESLRTEQADKNPTSPNPVKSFLKPKPDEKKIPKAVMPKKEVVNGE